MHTLTKSSSDKLIPYKVDFKENYQGEEEILYNKRVIPPRQSNLKCICTK